MNNKKGGVSPEWRTSETAVGVRGEVARPRAQHRLPQGAGLVIAFLSLRCFIQKTLVLLSVAVESLCLAQNPPFSPAGGGGGACACRAGGCLLPALPPQEGEWPPPAASSCRLDRRSWPSFFSRSCCPCAHLQLCVILAPLSGSPVSTFSGLLLRVGNRCHICNPFPPQSSETEMFRAFEHNKLPGAAPGAGR